MKGPVLAVAAAGLLAVGALAGVMFRDSGSGVRDPGLDARSARDSAPASSPSPLPEHEHASMPGDPRTSEAEGPNPGNDIVTLTPEMMARAGIRTAVASTATATTQLHLPGVVEPNAYKDVQVTSLVSGRVTQVQAELGQRVAAGESLAMVYSPELADAQTAFIAARAALAAHDLELTRTQRLYAIGAASRQELEKLDAGKSEMDHMVETARARLALLGVPEERAQRLASPADVVTTFDVKAPIAGMITKRSANLGLNIDLATPLFSVTDLTTVWVVADLYERDFAAVGVGSSAAVTTPVYPAMNLRGRVDYIDPQVQADTRTAKLRVEVPNAANRLRLGMFVDVSIGRASARPVVVVPRAALQAVGPQSVVYVAVPDMPGTFAQRTVTPGGAIGGDVAILEGLHPGDLVVTDGAFFLRAQHEQMSPDKSGLEPSGDVVFPTR